MLKCGDKLQFTCDATNPVAFLFKKGDILTLIEPTGLSPHGFKSNLGNWLVDGPNGKTVWSSIWLLFEYGILVKV